MITALSIIIVILICAVAWLARDRAGCVYWRQASDRSPGEDAGHYWVAARVGGAGVWLRLTQEQLDGSIQAAGRNAEDAPYGL